MRLSKNFYNERLTLRASKNFSLFMGDLREAFGIKKDMFPVQR